MMIWIVAVALLLLLLLCLRSEYEKRHLAVDVFRISSEKIREGERTFVFLSDLHDNSFGREQKELLEALDQIEPDAVFIGGDMMVTNRKKGTVDTEKSLFLVEKLAASYPVYYGFGNHESRMEWARDQFGDIYESYVSRLRRMGVKLLIDGARYPIGRDVAVAGLEIPRGCYRKAAPEWMDVSQIRAQIGTADQERYQILLAHTPAMFEQYRAWGADLTLAGHFHGGTIRIPFLGGLMTPQFQFFYPYCGGKFEKDGKTLIVSRGMGTHSVNLRLNNQAQLVVIKLSPEAFTGGKVS